jgi:aminoglycoside phosphotransferase (APT) family kinase protein
MRSKARMTLPIAELSERLARYLSERDGVPTEISDVARIPGGASRETYRLKARQRGAVRGMILRRDPETSLIDTDRATEYAAYVAAFRSGVIPVPEPLVLEQDERHLGRPFSLTAEIPGCETNVQLIPPERRRKVAEQKWSILGRLAALDIDALDLRRHFPTPRPEEAARRELDYWAGVIEKDALQPQPIAEAAVRWLRRNLPPAPAKLALVHGDYRSGNFLFDGEGEIRGILDWEMAHLGDPLEDLGWSFDPLWAWPEKHLAGRLAPRLDAIRIFEAASGLKVDLDVFRWWEVFASLKAVAIWISSAEDFDHGANKEPILGAAGWLTADRQNRILVDRLSPVSKRVYTERLAP